MLDEGGEEQQVTTKPNGAVSLKQQIMDKCKAVNDIIAAARLVIKDCDDATVVAEAGKQPALDVCSDAGKRVMELKRQERNIAETDGTVQGLRKRRAPATACCTEVSPEDELNKFDVFGRLNEKGRVRANKLAKELRTKR